MPGFCVCNKKVRVKLSNEFEDKCVSESLDHNEYFICRNTLNKFLDDKLFVENHKYIVITEGVILNKKELCQQFQKAFFNVVTGLIDKNEYSYFDLFRGGFSGAHYHKKKKEWVFYTNHVEDKSIFYYSHGGVCIVATDMNYIITILKELGISYTVDEGAIYNMLTYGFMVSNRTYVKEIKKLPYGCYLVERNGYLTQYRYYDIDTESCKYRDWDESDLIEEWDRLFKKAITLEYEKDLEYGYTHISALSGGLDSRMNTWVARSLGFDNILNVCFSQSDYLDEKIAKIVSQTLGTELIVKSLNGGQFLADYQKIVRMNYGLSLYSGIAHSDSINRYLNFDQLGLIHTGLLGGVNSISPSKFRLEGAYSQKLANRIPVSDLRPSSMDLEKYKIITREFKGNFATQIAISNYTESITPFQYKEFFEFYLNIPYEKRKQDRLYYKWIINKYPKAAQIPVERLNNGYVTDGIILQKFRKVRQLGLLKSFEWILWKLHFKKNLDKRLLKENMNPYDKWYNENASLKNELDSYYIKMRKQLEKSELLASSIIQDMSYLYDTGTTGEKTQVITVLAAIELFFMEEDNV